MNTRVHRTAFTLIEILVVVAIIAILLALLMPSLKRAKETANSVACVNNLRQIYVAVHAYAQDNEDSLPTPIYWWRQLGNGKYVGGPAPIFGPKTTDWGWAASYRRWPVFRCAGEKGVSYTFTGAGPSPVLSTIYDSDLDNCSYDNNWSMNHYAYYSTSPPRKLSAQPDCQGGAAAAWMYMDCQGYSVVGWYWNYREWGIDTDTDAVKYAFRHPGNKANAVFFDGHCGTLQHISVTGKPLWIYIWSYPPG